MTKHSCQNCRYKSRSVLKEPCSTGSYQLFFSKRCFVWKPRRWYQRFLDIIMSKKKEETKINCTKYTSPIMEGGGTYGLFSGYK